MKKTPRIAAIVLAAGQSKRAGPVNKLLNPVGDKVMVRSVVDMLTALPIGPVVVVTGFEASEIEAVLSDCSVTFSHNLDFADGMGSSIGCGVAALPDDVDGVLICLADMPHVKGSTIQQLVRAMEKGDICVPVKKGKRGNPVLFSASHFPALKAIQGDRGGKFIMEKSPDLVCEVPVNDEGIFIDHDRIE